MKVDVRWISLGWCSWLAWTVIVAPASAATLGMAGDDAADQAVVFDADTGTVLGAVDVGPGSVGDCEVTPDQSLGLIVDFASRLWLIDLQQTPPVLASGVNPVPISNFGVDVDLTPDGRRAVVCGGSEVSVVDVAARAEIDTFDLGHDCQVVDICDDGSVLVGWISI
ncbi:MAG: hypothetical protein AAF560_33175, partial [Acidobacteriota bacterium]